MVLAILGSPKKTETDLKRRARDLAGAGELVAKNQLIGQITDPFGVVVEEVRAPMTGVIKIINFPSARSTGDPFFSICELER